MTDYRDLWYHSEDGLALYARDYGQATDRPTVLCMHGLSRNAADFEGLAAHLGSRYRVIAVDQRGRGRSDYDSHSEHYVPAIYVRDMFTLLDSQQIDEVILIGTSMGGLMAFMMAAMQAQRVKALVINDIGPEVDPRGLARIQSYVGKSSRVTSWEEAVAQQRDINGLSFPDFSDDQWRAFTRRLYRERDGVPVLAYDPAIAEPIAASESNAVPPDLWPLLDAIQSLPVLVLRGELSDILSRDCVQKMQARHPALQAVEIANRGHAPTLDEPSAREAIDGFLDSLAE